MRIKKEQNRAITPLFRSFLTDKPLVNVETEEKTNEVITLFGLIKGLIWLAFDGLSLFM
jgi:hypothetical protein